MNWELISSYGFTTTLAMYVGSGCIVMTILFDANANPISFSTTFIPHVIILTDKQGNKTIGMP